MYLMTFRKFKIRTLLAACVFAASGMFFVGCSSKNEGTSSSASDAAQADDASFDGKILDGIRINGLNVGGLKDEEARKTLETNAENSLKSMTFTLQYGSQSWSLSAADFGLQYDYDAALSQAFAKSEGISRDEKKQIAAEGFDITIPLLSSPTSIDSALSKIAQEIDKDPVEPSVSFVPERSERFTYTGAEPGTKLDMAGSLKAIQAAIDQGVYPANIQLLVETLQPGNSLEDLQKNTTRIATATTKYESKGKENRTFNLKKGTELLHGTVVKPGREFSFNETTGARDEKNGWKAAPTIVDGTMFEDDFGGGICQVSTTMFNAIAKAGLKITERNKHSIPSSYVPLGLDAMVSYGSKDFRFVNNTDYPIYITATCEGGSLTFAVWGRPLPDGQSIKLRSETIREVAPGDPEIFDAESLRPGQKETVRKAKTGYDVVVYKETLGPNDELINSEKFYSVSYAPIRAVVRVGSGTSAQSSGTDTSTNADSSDSSSDSSSGTTLHDGFEIPEE